MHIVKVNNFVIRNVYPSSNAFPKRLLQVFVTQAFPFGFCKTFTHRVDLFLCIIFIIFHLVLQFLKVINYDLAKVVT